MNAIYPPESAETWDRVGLSVGVPTEPVRRVLFAVDPCAATVQEAITTCADMLITHHPLLLRGTSSVAAATGKGRWITEAIRHHLAIFSAHTNADVAASTRALAEPLGVNLERPLDVETGIGGVGTLPEPLSLRGFAHAVERVIPRVPAGILVAGDPDARIERVAICSGAGQSLLDAANAAGADVYLTADLRHHPATDHLWNGGCALVCATHFATEWPLLGYMQAALAEKLPELETEVSTIVTDAWGLALRGGDVEPERTWRATAPASNTEHRPD